MGRAACAVGQRQVKWGVYEILIRCGYSYCTRCGRVLPVGRFFRDSSKKHGLRYHCADCVENYRSGKPLEFAPTLRPRTTAKLRAVFDLQWVLERSGLAYCCKGDHILPRSEFYPHRENAHGLHSHCRACHMQYQTAERQREKVTA